MKNFIVISGLFLLSACAGAVKPVAIDFSAKTVGVISAIPQELHIDSLGRNIFEGGNVAENMSLPMWPINGVADEAIRGVLAPRYAVTVVPTPPGFGVAGGLFSNAPNIGEQIRELVHGPSTDLYVVLWMSPQALPPNTALVPRLGMGIYQNSFVLGNSKPQVYAHLAISVVDGRSFKVLTTTHLEDVLNHGEAVSGIENYEWKDHWYKMTDAERGMILQLADSLLQKSIVTTLKEMNLSSL
jgi:hypothetical protein